MRIGTLSFVVLTLVMFEASYAHEFNWDNLLMAKMKLDEGFHYKTYADAYMKIYRPNVWKRCQNDEFELDERRQETIELMKERVENFPIEERFMLYTTLTIGKYNFSQARFPVVEATGRHYWWSSPRHITSDFPSSLGVHFENPEIYHTIPMQKADAKRLLDRRKNRHGEINRRIDVVMQFRILRVNAPKAFLCEIESVRFFEDSTRTRLLHEVTIVDPEKVAQD